MFEISYKSQSRNDALRAPIESMYEKFLLDFPRMFARTKKSLAELIQSNSFETFFDVLLSASDAKQPHPYDMDNVSPNEILDMIISQPEFPQSEMIKLIREKLDMFKKHEKFVIKAPIGRDFIVVDVLSHPNLPSEFIEEIYSLSEDSIFRSLLISHPNIPMALLRAELSIKDHTQKSYDYFLRNLEAALLNPNLPLEYVTAIFTKDFTDKNGTRFFSKALQRNDLPIEVFFFLLEEKIGIQTYQALLHSIITHPNCPVEVSATFYPFTQNKNRFFALKDDDLIKLDRKYRIALKEFGYDDNTISALTFEMKVKILAQV